MNNKVKFKGPMKHFMRWPLYLSVLVVLLDLLVFIVSVKAGILVSVGTVIYIFIAVQLFRYHKPLIINDMIAFANQYDVVEKRMLEELALPYAIMDMEGRMIWSNRIFSEITGRDQFTFRGPDLPGIHAEGDYGRSGESCRYSGGYVPECQSDCHVSL